MTHLHGDLETLKVFLYKLKSSEYSGLQEQKGMVPKAMRLSALHGVWSSSIRLSEGSTTSTKQITIYASQAVHHQIAIIVTGGIIDLEIDLS